MLLLDILKMKGMEIDVSFYVENRRKEAIYEHLTVALLFSDACHMCETLYVYTGL